MKRINVYAGVMLLFLVVSLWQCSSPTEPRLALSDKTLTFEAGETQKTITIGNSGGGDLTWKARENPDEPWLSISPDLGKAGDPMTITIEPAQLNPGTHTGGILVTSNDGEQNLTVTVLISKLSISPAMIVYESSENAENLEIRNLGAGKLNWNISKLGNIPWLTVDPASGDNDLVVTLAVDRNGISTGSHQGVLVVSSTGGVDTALVTVSRLPSATFLDEFSVDLANWTVRHAAATANNGLLELTGTSSAFFGVASHGISPVRPAPWLYRVAFGRKNSLNSSMSSMVMETDDAGRVIIPAYRFDLISNTDMNWAAAAFVFNTATFEGQWALLDTDSKGLSDRIKVKPGQLNDISWAITPSKSIHIFVDGEPFYQSDILNQLSSSIGVELESVGILTSTDLTTIADWALLREAEFPTKVQAPFAQQSKKRVAIMQLARRQALRQLRDGAWQHMPTLREVYEQMR